MRFARRDCRYGREFGIGKYLLCRRLPDRTAARPSKLQDGEQSRAGDQYSKFVFSQPWARLLPGY